MESAISSVRNTDCFDSVCVHLRNSFASFVKKRGFKYCIKLSAYDYRHSYSLGHWKKKSCSDWIDSYESISDPTFPLLIRQFLDSRPASSVFCVNALNYAILAWKSRQLSLEEYTENISTYISRACGCLNGAISGSAVFLPHGVFASHLLAWIAYSCSQEFAAPLHFKGSLAWLSAIFDMSREKGESPPEILTTHGPYIIDCSIAWVTRHGAIPNRSTDFSQQVKYFEELRRIDESDSWRSGILEAANSTLGNLMEIALTWVYNITTREAAFNSSRDNVNDVLQYIRSELGDMDLYTSLKTIYEGFQGFPTNHSTVEGQLITRLFHRLRCILLLLTLLEADSIMIGVLTRKANFIVSLGTVALRRYAVVVPSKITISSHGIISAIC